MLKVLNGLYEISNEGNIRSKNYNKTKNTKPIKPFGKNYLMIALYKNNKKQYRYIHRLVAESFVANINNYKIVNHINGNKKDNRASNLEWCTCKHNIREAFRLGLSKNKKGVGNGRSKKVKQFTLDNKFIREWESMRLAEQHLNIKHIHECCAGKRKTAGGYKWQYE